MALSDDEKDVFGRLSGALSAAKAPVVADLGMRSLDLLDQYYEGYQRVAMLGITLPEQMRGLETVINWPATVVDALEHRLDVEGFRTRDSASDDAALWGLWQANDLDEESQRAHQDALVYGRSYVVVGADDDGDPVVTVESAHEMVHETDPRTRRPRAALRRWSDPYSFARQAAGEYATLFLPGLTVQLDRGERGQWQEADRATHDLGEVMVTPLVYGRREKRPLGRSFMLPALGMADAVCRAVTNAQAATELLAVPTRWALGVKPEDMVDSAGKPIPAWQFYLGAIWTSANADAEMGQFPAADLRNFDVIISTHAKLLAGLYGLPIRYFGEATSNPPSEGSIVADESRLIKRAERTAKTFGGAWERALRLAAWVADGRDPKTLASLETRWRDPATPTRAQTTDAVTKLWQTGRYPTRAGLEDMGKSAVQIDQIMAQLKAEQEDPLFAALGKAPAADPQPAQESPAEPPQDVTDADAAPVG